MPSTPPSFPVRHDPASRRYEAVVDGLVARLDYRTHGVLRLYTHMWTPPELRGRGVAAAVARTALDDDLREQRRIVPLCTYVARFIEQHPEYRALVDRD